MECATHVTGVGMGEVKTDIVLAEVAARIGYALHNLLLLNLCIFGSDTPAHIPPHTVTKR
eukprot:5689383-Amphidinium_carterae.2